MKYDTPIESFEHALWCLNEAKRRYVGTVVIDADSDFPLIEDAIGRCHTDQVLREIGADYGERLRGKFPFG